MDYSSFLMDSAYHYSLSKLDKIKKRCIRLIEYKSKSTRERDLNKLMVEYRLSRFGKEETRNYLASCMSKVKIKTTLKNKKGI